MLRSGFYILCMISCIGFGQELPDKASDALKEYIQMREGFKSSWTKEFSRTDQFTMDDWCLEMGKKFPETYETSFANYLNGKNYFDSGEDLFNAYSLSPDKPAVQKELFAFYIMKGEMAKAEKLLPNVSAYYSRNSLNFFKDMSQKSGFLIVSSLEDAIPLYILQFKGEIDDKVKVLCMDFLIHESYCKRFEGALGTGGISFFGNEKAYLKKAMNVGKAHLAVTVPINYISGNESNCYLVGLTHQSNPTNQRSVLEKFSKVLASKNLSSLALTGPEKRLYSNYLPGLLTLYKIKKSGGEEDKSLRTAIEALGAKIDQSNAVSEILKGYD